MKFPLSIALVATLSACGGGGGSSGGGGPSIPAPKPLPTVSASAFDTFVNFETAHSVNEAEKMSQFHAAFTAGQFPTTGTVNFIGTWRNVLDASGTPTILIGLADVDANFATTTFSGTIDEFVGEINGGATGFYAGIVTISNGEIGKAAPGPGSAQNDIRFDYAGNLTGNGQVIVLSGSNDMGKFLQTPITGVEATGSSTATLDGLSVTDDMSLYADRN